MIANKWAMLTLLVILTGCSKNNSFSLAQIEYRQECFGDLTVKCRSKLIDLNVVKLEAAIEAMENRKSDIVACKGERFYDEGIALIHDRIDYFKELKPNIFVRTVLSSMNVEFELPHYRSEAAFETFQTSARNCGDARAPTAATVPATPNAIAGDALDSNAQGRPQILQTIAGELARKDMPNGQTALTLDGKQLFSGEDAQWQFPLRIFSLSNGLQAILVASSGGRGNSCETLFFFLMADKSGVKPTPEFGTCSATGKIRQNGDLVMLMLPKMGGNSLYVLDGATMSEDGKPITLVDSNNPAN